MAGGPLPNLLKQARTRKGVDAISLAETASVGLCGLAVLLWMSIGSFSRSEARELLAQQVIALHQMGGELWGSRNVARPMAVIAVIVALAGMLNIKGKDIQGETNPHKIAKMRQEEE